MVPFQSTANGKPATSGAKPAEAPQWPLRVLGVDPGLAEVGYAVLEQPAPGRPIAWIDDGTIRTTPDQAMSQRLRHIYRELTSVIRTHRPQVLAIEELFFSTNRTTAFAVAQARGVAILASAESELHLAEYSPPQIKQAIVGYGKASKDQVQHLVRAILKLDETERSSHAADAIATALCHLHLGAPLTLMRLQVQSTTAGASALNLSLPLPDGSASSPADAPDPAAEDPRTTLNKSLLGRQRRRPRR